MNLYESTLFKAIENSDLEIVTEIIQEKLVDVNVKNTYGKTPLHYAVSKDNICIMQFLKDHGACINSQNRDGLTPLHCAVMSSCFRTIKWLIDNGARVNIKNCFNMTALEWLIQKEIFQKIYDNQNKVTIDEKQKMLLLRICNLSSSIVLQDDNYFNQNINEHINYNSSFQETLLIFSALQQHIKEERNIENYNIFKSLTVRFIQHIQKLDIVNLLKENQTIQGLTKHKNQLGYFFELYIKIKDALEEELCTSHKYQLEFTIIKSINDLKEHALALVSNATKYLKFYPNKSFTPCMKAFHVADISRHLSSFLDDKEQTALLLTGKKNLTQEALSNSINKDQNEYKFKAKKNEMTYKKWEQKTNSNLLYPVQKILEHDPKQKKTTQSFFHEQSHELDAQIIPQQDDNKTNLLATSYQENDWDLVCLGKEEFDNKMDLYKFVC